MLLHFRLAVILALVAASVSQAQDLQPTPAAALQKLKDGNAHFAADQPSKRDVKAERRKELAKGQEPFAVVLACADSRVAPELIFDAGIGELFVLRVAGNIADPAVVGSIEYAVEHLHAPLIVVLGHDSCGAVAAAVDGKPHPGDLGWLIKQVKVGDKLPDDKEAKLAAGVRHNVRAAAADIELRSKVVYEKVKGKKVAIVGGVYVLKTGQIEWLSAPEKKKAAPEMVEAPKQVEVIPARPAFPAPSVGGALDNRGVVAAPPPRFPRIRALFQRWR
jgi:carbonic anhydrase